MKKILLVIALFVIYATSIAQKTNTSLNQIIENQSTSKVFHSNFELETIAPPINTENNVATERLCRVDACYLGVVDGDGDGFGIGDVVELVMLPSNLVFLNNCSSPGVIAFCKAHPFPAGYSTLGGDCDDTDPNIHDALFPTITLANSVDTSCSGRLITFTGTATDAGILPQFSFTVNGNVVQNSTNPVFNTTTLAAGINNIICTVTPTNIVASCLVAPNAQDNKKVTIIQSLTPTVSIATAQNVINLGATAIFTATPVNGGTAPIYDFKLNGISKQKSSSNTFSSNTLQTNDVVSCVLTANNNCQTIDTAKSNNISMIVLLGGCSPLSAITGPSTICKGSSVQLTNTTTGGTWNSLNASATIDANTGILSVNGGSGNAVIKYTVVSPGCNVSTTKTIVINPTPAIPSIAYAPGTVNPQYGVGGSFCAGKIFTLVGTPTGGVWSSTGAMSIDATSGLVTLGGSAGAIAVTYTKTVNNCSNSKTISGTITVCSHRGGASSNETITNDKDFTIYPNPAKSLISLNVKTLVGSGQIVVTDLLGKQLKTQPLSIGSNSVDVSFLCKGFYLVSIITSEGKSTKKLVVE